MKRMNLHTHGEQDVLLSLLHWMVTRDFNYQISSFQWFFSSYRQTPCIYIPLVHIWWSSWGWQKTFHEHVFRHSSAVLSQYICVGVQTPSTPGGWRTILQGHRHYATKVCKILHEHEFIKNLWHILEDLPKNYSNFFKCKHWNCFHLVKALQLKYLSNIFKIIYWGQSGFRNFLLSIKAKIRKKGPVCWHCLYNNPYKNNLSILNGKTDIFSQFKKYVLLYINI